MCVCVFVLMRIYVRALHVGVRVCLCLFVSFERCNIIFSYGILDLLLYGAMDKLTK